MKIIDSILTDAASIAAIRKDIHAHPELCFQEVRTADVVAQQLTDWGIPIHRGMGTTGVIGIVHGRDGGACGRGVGLRARPVVHAKHGLHGELVEHAVFDHFAGTAAAFFGRLEN